MLYVCFNLVATIVFTDDMQLGETLLLVGMLIHGMNGFSMFN
jgi:hypothetical protein